MSCWMSSSRLHTTLIGILGLLGNQRGLDDEVELEPPAEAAAQEVIVNAHLLRLETEGLRHRLLRDGGDLRADPDIAAVGASPARCSSSAPWSRGRGTAPRSRLRPWSRRWPALPSRRPRSWRPRPASRASLRQRCHDVGRGERGVRSVVELGRTGLETFPRGPVVVGDHGDGIVELRDLMHARQLSRPPRRRTMRALPPNTGDAATVATFMPGTFTSMPYTAVPLTLPATSSRLAGVPMMRKVLGSLSLTLVGTGSFAAASASSP